ncbi:hypothetical protein XELAEV_18020462mg [Xenopus laevis]|uniref:IF rod domain-containing protein n=1 Tax=Xenopus laevis TaxID=8355 RepID=A0A974D7U8_XENLA|nr:hypothetical protein XELAEV_18020462mg [Xenopus laevis]
MLSMRRTFGDEKAELRELNSRLDQYLSRVRQLEAENKLLVGEIQTLRVERGREWAHGYEAEIAELRRKVEELTVQKCEAEIQRENLWQELQSLQELWDQVRAMRLRIDQQLVQYNQDLQQARKGQAALEELYNRLLQECHMLRGSQHEELVLLRERALTVPMTIAMQETVHPRLSMQDVQSFSLELSESWKETFLLYLKKIEELESYVILSEQSRQEAEEEARAQGVKVVELRREHEELMRMRKMLEKELLRMKEKYMLEMEEYQIIIEELEQEKQTVTVTITDRLQDYHELMKLKTGLSLEVATYRALLEAESQKGTFTWIDQSVKNRPADKGAEPVKTGESEEDITSAEDLTKNSVVEGIIKHFGQSSGLDDANVTYVEKKEQASDGSVKTKIFVETKTKEEVDFLDEPDLTDLWNSSSYQRIQEGVARAATNAVEDEQKQKETETIIGEGKGVDDWIKIMIQNELKVRSGVSFNVEIIEESTGAFVTEKTDFITPFHVEEVEDNIQATESACFYDKPQDPVKADDLQSETQVQRHAEEVTEGGDEDEETNYFVSVPDDIPLVQDEDQETLRGQIHIEDSHVKYSWQDAFLQGSQGQKALSEFIRYAGSNESETIVHDILDDDKEHRIESQQQPKTETFVIEKEIKIPHEFQSSIIGLFSKDIKHPQQQLKGTLECLQGSLPENIVVELSSLAEEQKAQDSSLAIDIKKVEQPTDTSMVTIVAEINLSQTVDADKLDTQGLLGDSMSEEVVATLLEKTKGEYSIFMNESATKSGYHLTSEIDNEGATSISKDNTDNATNGSFSTKVKLLHKQISTESRFIKHIQLETYEQATEENTSPISTNRSIHHIKFEPREMTFDEKNISEGPMSDIVELDISKGAEESADYSRPIRHITLSPTETYTVEQIVFEGPIFKTVSSGGSTEDFAFGELPKDSSSHKNVHDNIVEIEDSRTQKSNNESIYQTETITGGIKTIKHYILNPRDTGMAKGIIIDGAMPKVQLHQKTDSLEGNIMPTEHRFGSQKIQVATQVKHQGFVSEPYKVADSGKLVEEEENSNVNTLVHHIKLSPNKEQIVFEGPISSNVHISRQEGSSQMEVENRSIKHIILGAKKAQTSESLIFEGPVSESYVFEGPISSNVHINSQEGSSQMEVENRSITDIILGAKEAKTSESVIFEGPVSESCESWDLSPSGDSSESEGSIKHIKLGPTEKSFTFQMDITQIATKHNGQGDVQGREIVITSSNFERLPGTSQSYSELTDDLEVSESGYGEEDTSGISQDVAEIQTHKLSFKETPAFEKTVHVQRIAQQSSLVSDDNKVVIVYLDEEEEPDQDYLQRSF